MTLKEWIAECGSIKNAAKKARLPRTAMHNYVGGYCRPSLEMANKISKASGGRVTMQDFLRIRIKPRSAAINGTGQEGEICESKTNNGGQATL